MAKDAPLGLRVEQEVKDALVQAAKDERRSLANLAEIILSDWLKERGYLKQ